jgi:hypothetical protein
MTLDIFSTLVFGSVVKEAAQHGGQILFSEARTHPRWIEIEFPSGEAFRVSLLQMGSPEQWGQ